MFWARIVAAATAVALFVPVPARAQDAARWGVTGSIIPHWYVPARFGPLFDGAVDVTGRDFTIGVARGRELGGDWGISYVHKRITDGSRVDNAALLCDYFANGCFLFGDAVVARRVTLIGIEAHKFIPLGTIRRRVQFGVNLAGGIGAFHGDLEKHLYDVDFVSYDAGTSQTSVRQNDRMWPVPASELTSLSRVPLGKVQAAVGAIVAPGLKIRAQAGFDFPGYEKFSIVGVYLFGVKR